MKTKKTFLVYYIPSILVMMLIFYFSSKTGTDSNSQSDPITLFLLNIFPGRGVPFIVLSAIVRKLGHIIEFTLLGFFLMIAFIHTPQMSLFKSTIATLSIGYLYGLLDEFHQLFVPGRSGLFVDSLVDLIGIILGIGVYITLHTYRMSKVNLRKIK